MRAEPTRTTDVENGKPDRRSLRRRTLFVGQVPGETFAFPMLDNGYDPGGPTRAYAGAVAALRALAKKRPNKSSVVGMLADLELQIDDFSSAVEHARRAVQLNPESEMAWRIL